MKEYNFEGVFFNAKECIPKLSTIVTTLEIKVLYDDEIIFKSSGIYMIPSAIAYLIGLSHGYTFKKYEIA